MTAKLDYRWNLRAVMADRGMFSTTDLRPLLMERGITLSPTQVWRLVTEKPERLNLKVLLALMDILGCRMDELIEPVAAAGSRRRRVAGEGSPNPGTGTGRGTGTTDAGLGSFRPPRARIVSDEKS